MPPPITSSRSGTSASSSAPVESMIRGSSSGRPGSARRARAGGDDAVVEADARRRRPRPRREDVGRGERAACRARPRPCAAWPGPSRPAGELADDRRPSSRAARRGRSSARRSEMPCAADSSASADHAGDVQQRLGRDAADVEADAAEPLVALDEHGLEPEVGGAERGRVAAGPGAEHDHVGLRRRRRAPASARRGGRRGARPPGPAVVRPSACAAAPRA